MYTQSGITWPVFVRATKLNNCKWNKIMVEQFSFECSVNIENFIKELKIEEVTHLKIFDNWIVLFPKLQEFSKTVYMDAIIWIIFQ